MRTAHLASMLALLAGAAAAAQESTPSPTPTPTVRERVEALLGAIDRPVPAGAWKALGPEAVPILEESLRADAIASRRSAAATGLAAIGGDRAVEALQHAAQSDLERWSVRAAAVRGLGVAVPADRLPAVLRPIMERAATRQVRGVAAEVLSRHAPSAACGAIRSQLVREAPGAKNDAGFARAAARCGGR